MCSKLGYCNPRIDICLREIIQRINEVSKYKTLSSCCGHGIFDHTIIVENKESGFIKEWFTDIPIQRQVLNRYYKRVGKYNGSMYKLKEYEKVIGLVRG